MDENTLLQKIEKEFKIAKQAQTEGKVGMARVCARRAAGWTIQLKLMQEGIELNTKSAFDHIKFYNEQADTKAEIKKILDHLQVKVKKESMEEEAYWPFPDVDLIQEAERLYDLLIG